MAGVDNDQLAMVHDLREQVDVTGYFVPDSVLWDWGSELVRQKGWTRNIDPVLVHTSEDLDE